MSHSKKFTQHVSPSISIQEIAPAELKSGGAALTINYSFYKSFFGNLIIASTTCGICHISFGKTQADMRADLQSRFPNATFHLTQDPLQKNALMAFEKDRNSIQPIKLHVAGTKFQIKVWESLLKIPIGACSTYKDVSWDAGYTHAYRATGSAIARNPVALLIPCHRVIKSSGALGNYMWGADKKADILRWERALSGIN